MMFARRAMRMAGLAAISAGSRLVRLPKILHGPTRWLSRVIRYPAFPSPAEPRMNPIDLAVIAVYVTGCTALGPGWARDRRG